MKKVVVIMLMSLLFLATFAQRPSKSRSTEVSNNERNKSEVTVNRSHEITSRSDDDPVTPNSNYSNRSADDKIVSKKTEVHKDIESRSGYNSNSGRVRSISSRTYEVERRNYNTPDRNRIHHEVYKGQKPKPIEYRRIYHPYHAPVNVHVVWTRAMYNEYIRIYPEFRYWYYPAGYRIHTISAYDATYYVGDVVNVYGRVCDTWHSRETDEYFLYFGARYPYQDFTVIIPGHKARQFSRRPDIFFEGRYIWVTGLISQYRGQPEMVIMKKHQVHLY
jgi:hypothetical protein